MIGIPNTPTPPGIVRSYRARRRLEIAPGRWREPGELVPEAATWVRVDAWLHGGHLELVELAEADFRAAITEHCPQHEAQLHELAGLSPAQPELVALKPAPKVAAAKKA